MFFVQKAHKLFAVKQDVALAASAPADVDLEGIVPAMGIVLVACSLHAFRFGAVGHNKERSDIVPLQPDRKQALDIVDPICNFPVDVHDILVQRVVCFDDLNSVLAELPNCFLVNVLRKGMQIFDMEASIEEVLTAHELYYEKSEVWIETEKMYEVLYELTV